MNMKDSHHLKSINFLYIFCLILLMSSCESPKELDEVTLKLSNQNILYVNLSLGFIMLGVALKLQIKDFILVFSSPKSVFVGFVSQFFALPFFTFLLVLIFKPMPSVALGMILVAACPGGNISNFMASLANGNAALSVCMTAVASVCAVFMTPFNISFWASIYPPTADILNTVNLNFWELLRIVGIILLIPLILGLTIRAFRPKVADFLQPFMHYGSILIFAAIIILAFRANMDLFLNYVHLIVFIVFAHNAVGIATGLGLARLFKLPKPDQKTLAIETGIQNSGLGLGLIFAFFDGLGGMAIVAGWWGIWHIVSGLSLAYFFKNRSL